MKNSLRTLLMYCTCMVGCVDPAMAEIEYLNLELKRLPFQRDPYFPGMTYWDYKLNLDTKTSIGPVFLESSIVGETYNSRFRHVKWDYTLGVNVFTWLDLVWDHMSRHRIDYESEKFPVQDSYGIRVKFYE